MKKRSESFFGIHCDFHARPWMGEIGRTLKEEDIRRVCRELKPDFWQIDCKGHFGWASYPSELGNAMPCTDDPLALWRKVTREEGVALYMHYSGLWDEKYCNEHPEEAILHADGTYDKNIVFPLSRYVDTLMIPQISELVEKYGIDGVWIDGDCWASTVDYREETLRAFEKDSGHSLNGQKPQSPTDPYFYEYVEYNRNIFRRYVKHYVDTLHQKYPSLQITSNWLFSDHMPEPVTIGIDFISGDTAPFNSLNATRFAARYLPQQNLPWDIMGMAQRYNGDGKPDLLPVHPTQLMQQAAATISMGGAFQFGLSQYFDGSPRMINLMSYLPVANFLREREKYCFMAKPIPQAAVLLSSYERYDENPSLFTRGRDDSRGIRGLTSLLCNAGQSFEIISEHTLNRRANEYSLIAIPELLHGLAPETVEKLLDYAKAGGDLLLTGVNTCKVFAKAGAPFIAAELDDTVPQERFLGQRTASRDQRFFTVDGTSMGAVLYPIQVIGNGDSTTVAQSFYCEYGERKPLAIVAPFGKGTVSAIGFDIGTAYGNDMQHLHRDLMKKMTQKLYTPLARIETAVGFLDLVCLEKDGATLIQLMNGNGNHHNTLCDTEDFIPPVLDIEISIAIEKEPRSIILQPQGNSLPFEIRGGRAYVKIDRIDIHSIIEIEE